MRSVMVMLQLLVVFALPSAALAQDRSFLFTVTTPELRDQSAVLNYGAGYGHKTFEPFGGDGLEQNLGFQGNINGAFSYIAHAALALDDGATNSSVRGEIIAHLIRAEDRGVDISAGGGVLHEYSGTDVLIGRAVIGRQFTSWQSYGNVILEKPLSSDRDAIDLITTIGFSYRLSGAVRLGLEAVGQDLEGFWEEEEAEGGATIFVGPTVSIAIPRLHCTYMIGGGEIIRATRSARTSQALRDLPYKKGNGFIIRNMVNFGL